jgi:hypothetical protein
VKSLLEYISFNENLSLFDNDYINRNSWTNKLGKIVFDLDEQSFECLSDELRQLILEGNRTVYKSHDGDELKMGSHAEDRLERPIEKGGDGEKIERQEIIDMFKYAWDDIMEMNYDGKLKPFFDRRNNNKVNAWTIECQCYLKEENQLLVANGARPSEKTLWAVWLLEENGPKVDITIKTLYRGERMNHITIQERIKILRNGKIEQRFMGKKIN